MQLLLADIVVLVEKQGHALRVFSSPAVNPRPAVLRAAPGGLHLMLCASS